MALTVITEQYLEDIADAIRTQLGEASLYYPSEMAGKILSISGGGGLEYETGTWIPVSDTNRYEILFSNAHTVAPFFYMLIDSTAQYMSTTSSVYCVVYFNFHQLFGVAQNIDNNGDYDYGYVYRLYRNSATSISGGRINLDAPYTDPNDTMNVYPRYWAKETSIKAFCSNSDYFRSSRTYSWIAVWTT